MAIVFRRAENRPGDDSRGPVLLALIHRSAWHRNSPKFVSEAALISALCSRPYRPVAASLARTCTATASNLRRRTRYSEGCAVEGCAPIPYREEKAVDTEEMNVPRRFYV
jgi:hypothetical protein